MLKRIRVYNGIHIELLLKNTKTNQSHRNKMRIIPTNDKNKYERIGKHLLALRLNLLAEMLEKDIVCTVSYRIKHKYILKYIKAKYL